MGVYVVVLGETEFFGIHDFQFIPRAGEIVRLTRHDVDHTLTVTSIEHNLIRGGHGIAITCK